MLIQSLLFYPKFQPAVPVGIDSVKHTGYQVFGRKYIGIACIVYMLTSFHKK